MKAKKFLKRLESLRDQGKGKNILYTTERHSDTGEIKLRKIQFLGKICGHGDPLILAPKKDFKGAGLTVNNIIKGIKLFLAQGDNNRITHQAFTLHPEGRGKYRRPNIWNTKDVEIRNGRLVIV